MAAVLPGALVVALLVSACADPPDPALPISLSRSARIEPRVLLDLDLGTPGSRDQLGSGWSANEKTGGRSFVWGVGPYSELELELERPSDLYLHLFANPFPAPEPQELTVEINGTVVTTMLLRQGRSSGSKSVFVPRAAVVSGRNRLTLRYSRFRDQLDPLGRPLRRYSVAWDGIRVTRSSEATQSGKVLDLPADESLILRVRSEGEVWIQWDQLLLEGGAEGIEVRRMALASGAEEEWVGTLTEMPLRVLDGAGEARIRLSAIGPPESRVRLVAPRLEGRLESLIRPNVILVSIDTLRADHLTPYGYERETSPALAELVRDGVRFDQAFAAGPSTLISHASLFTSLLPQHHQASFFHRRRLPEKVLTLTEILSAAGYRCGSVNGGGQIDPTFGLDQGFEIYDSRAGHFFNVVRQGQRWMERDRESPFFLFLHSYEVHHPYEPRPWELEAFDDGYDGPLPDRISKELLGQINRGEVEVDEADLRHIVATYDALIRSMDRGLEELVGYLRANELYEPTLLVFLSDHGEEFGEHGWVGWHSHSLFDELLRVPLVFKLPGSEAAGRVVQDPVRLIDVAPTVLELLQLEIPDGFDGRSLRAALGDGLLSELPAVAMIDEEMPIASIRHEGWKWYRGRLYDLTSDPEEQHDLAAADPTRARALREELEELLAGREPFAPESIEVSEETEDRLRALGYL